MSSLSLVEFKELINESGSENDSALTALLRRAAAVFESETGVAIDFVGTRTKYPPSTGGDTVHLTEAPASITTLAWRVSPDADWQTIDAADFEHDGRRITRTDGGVFPKGLDLVRVTYPSGYGSGAAPGQYVQCVYDMAGHLWTNRRRVAGGIPPEVSESPNNWPSHCWRIMRRARGIQPGF